MRAEVCCGVACWSSTCAITVVGGGGLDSVCSKLGVVGTVGFVPRHALFFGGGWTGDGGGDGEGETGEARAGAPDL